MSKRKESLFSKKEEQIKNYLLDAEQDHHDYQKGHESQLKFFKPKKNFKQLQDLSEWSTHPNSFEYTFFPFNEKSKCQSPSPKEKPISGLMNTTSLNLEQLGKIKARSKRSKSSLANAVIISFDQAQSNRQTESKIIKINNRNKGMNSNLFHPQQGNKYSFHCRYLSELPPRKYLINGQKVDSKCKKNMVSKEKEVLKEFEREKKERSDHLLRLLRQRELLRKKRYAYDLDLLPLATTRLNKSKDFDKEYLKRLTIKR